MKKDANINIGNNGNQNNIIYSQYEKRNPEEYIQKEYKGLPKDIANKKVAVIGSGSYGCALSNIMSNNQNEVKIWSYSQYEKESINENHRCYQIPYRMNKDIYCTNSYEEAIRDTDYIFNVCPSSFVKKTCEDIRPYVNDQKIVMASKGMDEDKVLSEVAKGILDREIYVISGPSHAEQLFKGIPTHINYYGPDEIKALLENNFLKLEKSDDPIGMQIGASLKNIVAIGAGIVEGLGYESNTTSFYVTEGLKEIVEIGTSLGAKKETFYGLSGLGDLLTTAYSNDSRNKRCGLLFAKGKTIKEIKDEIGMTIEGLDALDSAHRVIKKRNLECRLIENLYNVVNNNQDTKSLLDIRSDASAKKVLTLDLRA